MRDREFLKWLHSRLQHVHHEPPQVDYMSKLRAIINATPPEQETPNVDCGEHYESEGYERVRKDT